MPLLLLLLQPPLMLQLSGLLPRPQDNRTTVTAADYRTTTVAHNRTATAADNTTTAAGNRTTPPVADNRTTITTPGTTTADNRTANSMAGNINNNYSWNCHR